MKKLLNILAAGFFGFAVQATVPSNGTPEAKLAQIKELLTPLLSENATIVFPDSEKWYDVTHRAAAPRVNPGYLAVVDVAAEDDVVNTVQDELFNMKRTLSDSFTDQSRERDRTPVPGRHRYPRLDRRYQQDPGWNSDPHAWPQPRRSRSQQ
ncbi:unnamed protein product [Aspergillus oryzae]|uniref:Unnamed protein product n=1 Tax=Aspergillus oryzae TaxID=5062 RepID=A0AAN4YD85_ASPOZ|nr:unnamed protein product [Aspergillus oryzae]